MRSSSTCHGTSLPCKCCLKTRRDMNGHKNRVSKAEYYVVGHDISDSLFDATLSSSSRQTASFLFGGIGDARNMFQTIMEMAAHERESQKKEIDKTYHFTILDTNSPAIARDLVVLMLLDELSELAHDAAKARSSKILQCLFYTYLSAIMPSSLHEVLQVKIAEAKTALEKNTLPPFIDIPYIYRADTVGYLDDWQRKVQQEYPVTRLQPAVVRTRGQYPEFVDLPPNGKAAKECDFEEQTGALILPAPYNSLLDPSLREALDVFGSRGSQSAIRKAVKAIHDTWSTKSHLGGSRLGTQPRPGHRVRRRRQSRQLHRKDREKADAEWLQTSWPDVANVSVRLPRSLVYQSRPRFETDAWPHTDRSVTDQVWCSQPSQATRHVRNADPSPTARRNIPTSIRPHPSQQRPRLYRGYFHILLVRLANDPSRANVIRDLDTPTKPSALFHSCGVRCRVRRTVQGERTREAIPREHETQRRLDHAHMHIQPVAPPHRLTRVQKPNAPRKPASMALPSLPQNRATA
jgi:hypothetical protein